MNVLPKEALWQGNFCSNNTKSKIEFVLRVETIDGSAKEQEDYEPLNEVLTFEPEEREKEIGVKIVDDNQWEPDEEFFVKLTLIPGKESEDVRLGRTSIMEITILNDDGNDLNWLLCPNLVGTPCRHNVKEGKKWPDFLFSTQNLVLFSSRSEVFWSKKVVATRRFQ